MEIYYLKNKEINIDKWDASIIRSFNGIIYGFSWYLNRVTDNWDALVQGDYERVMPLPAKQKYYINYIYQPFLAQQLGVFSTRSLSMDIVQSFLDAIPHKFKYVDINLNLFNYLNPDNTTDFTENVTHELDLIRAHEKIQQSYNTNTKRNIKKAHKSKVEVIKNVPVQAFMNFIRVHLSKRDKALTEEHFSVIKSIITFAMDKRLGEIYAALNQQNDPLAMTFFIKSHRKYIYLLAASSEEGFKSSAMFTLVDEFIRDNAGKNQVLDFEGSNISSISRFYRGFGAQPCTYPNYKRDNLYGILKLFKR